MAGPSAALRMTELRESEEEQGKGRSGSFPFGFAQVRMTNLKVVAGKQIPYGNDRKKGKGRSKSKY
jgi:hypothetical protein